MPDPSRLFGCLPLFVLLLLLSSPPLGRADEVPEKVRKVWAEREEKSARVEIRWQGTHNWLRSQKELATGVPEPMYVPTAYSRSGGLLLDGEKYRNESVRHVQDNGYQESWDVFNGTRSFQAKVSTKDAPPRSATFWKELKPLTTNQNENLGYDPLYWAVRPSLAIIGRRPGWKLIVGEERTDAGKLITLTELEPGGKDGRRTYWLNAETADVVRMEWHTNGNILVQYEVKYGRAETPWIPKTWTHAWGFSADKGPYVMASVQVDSVSLPKRVAADRFELKLTPGLLLWDEAEGEEVVYRIDPDGKKVLLPGEK